MNNYNIGVTEAVNTIIGQEIYHGAAELLKAPLEVLMDIEKMTERQALRIYAVSQITERLAVELVKQQQGKQCSTNEAIVELIKGMDCKNEMIILAMNRKDICISYIAIPIDSFSRQLLVPIFKFLYSEPCTQFACVAKKEQFQSNEIRELKDLAIVLKEKGQISDIPLLDVIVMEEERITSLVKIGVI